jgi:hypothetical protein
MPAQENPAQIEEDHTSPGRNSAAEVEGTGTEVQKDSAKVQEDITQIVP